MDKGEGPWPMAVDNDREWEMEEELARLPTKSPPQPPSAPPAPPPPPQPEAQSAPCQQEAAVRRRTEQEEQGEQERQLATVRERQERRNKATAMLGSQFTPSSPNRSCRSRRSDWWRSSGTGTISRVKILPSMTCCSTTSQST